VEGNREWPTDYRFALDPEGMPINRWVQIDMVPLPQDFLDEARRMSVGDVREALRGRIFEIENSLAMYQMMTDLFGNEEMSSSFKMYFRHSLHELRMRYGMPIALLAVTEQKYLAMKAAEFGKMPHEELTDAEVFELSGFDKFFGPEEFERYIRANGGECGYLLYARTSAPLAKLRDPSAEVSVPLLEDDAMRRVIKANAITFNIDGKRGKINDTKGYLPLMGMAYAVASEGDVFSQELIEYTRRGKPYADFGGEYLSPAFRQYLIDQGLDPEKVARGEIAVRAKPGESAYGCYGHVSGSLADREVRNELRGNLRRRGVYVLQPEMPVPVLRDSKTGLKYLFIDRNFMYTIDGEKYRFMGGFRTLMPVDSIEARKGRVHGNRSAVWAPVYAE
jgi:hypothetical protein